MRVLSPALVLLAATVCPHPTTVAFQPSPIVEGSFRSMTKGQHRAPSSFLRAVGEDSGSTATFLDESSSSSTSENPTGKSLTERMMAKAPQEGQ